MSEEEGEMEDPSSTLQEPFLSSPSAAQTLPDDSIRSTLSKYVSLAAVASGEEADSVESESDRERDLQVVLVGILGKPYADNTNFWCKLLPLSLLAGALMGVTTLLYQGSLQVLFHLWHPDAQTQRDSGEWKWLFLTSFGALGSALILLFPKAPNPGSVRNLFHDVNDLKVRKKKLFLVRSYSRQTHLHLLVSKKRELHTRHRTWLYPVLFVWQRVLRWVQKWPWVRWGVGWPVCSNRASGSIAGARRLWF